MGMKRWALVVCVLTLAGWALGQPRPHNLAPPPVRPGPWDNDLLIAFSKDGVVFERASQFVERGGVPHVVRDGKGRLVAVFQWFPVDRPEAFDRVAAKTSEDEGKTWGEARPIVVKGLPEGYMRPFDPTLVVLEDGRLRLYFTSHHPDRRTPAIYSAVGSDGVEYEFEPGMRFGVEREFVIDCAAVRVGKTFHLYSPVQDRAGRGYHAVSEDGLAFRRVEDVQVEGGRSWLGCAVTTAEGVRFYGTGRGVWSAVSADGASWKLDEQTRAEGADPGVARVGEGRYVMISTGPPRADAGHVRVPNRKPDGQ
jgi:hypothetical protein